MKNNSKGDFIWHQSIGILEFTQIILGIYYAYELGLETSIRETRMVP